MYQPSALWGFDWVITEGLPPHLPHLPHPRLGGFLTVKFGGLLESLSLAQTGGSSTPRGVAIDCAGMRKGLGGGGGGSGGVMVGGVCASIHGLRMRVSGWGGEEGGKVTRSQPPPMECRIHDLGCLSWFPRGCIDLPFRRQRCDVRVRYSPF